MVRELLLIATMTTSHRSHRSVLEGGLKKSDSLEVSIVVLDMKRQSRYAWVRF